MITILSPQSSYVDQTDSTTYTLTWTHSTEKQFEVMYRYKESGGSWLTSGKINVSQGYSYNLLNIRDNLGIDFEEIEYKLKVYYDETDASGNRITGTEESNIFYLIFNSGKTALLKVKSGSDVKEFPVFNTVNNTDIKTAKINVSGTTKLVPLVQSDNSLSSNFKIAGVDTDNLVVACSEDDAHFENHYISPTDTFTYLDRYVYRSNPVYSYGGYYNYTYTYAIITTKDVGSTSESYTYNVPAGTVTDTIREPATAYGEYAYGYYTKATNYYYTATLRGVGYYNYYYAYSYSWTGYQTGGGGSVYAIGNPFYTYTYYKNTNRTYTLSSTGPKSYGYYIHTYNSSSGSGAQYAYYYNTTHVALDVTNGYATYNEDVNYQYKYSIMGNNYYYYNTYEYQKSQSGYYFSTYTTEPFTYNAHYNDTYGYINEYSYNINKYGQIVDSWDNISYYSAESGFFYETKGYNGKQYLENIPKYTTLDYYDGYTYNYSYTTVSPGGSYSYTIDGYVYDGYGGCYHWYATNYGYKSSYSYTISGTSYNGSVIHKAYEDYYYSDTVYKVLSTYDYVNYSTGYYNNGYTTTYAQYAHGNFLVNYYYYYNQPEYASFPKYTSYYYYTTTYEQQEDSYAYLSSATYLWNGNNQYYYLSGYNDTSYHTYYIA